MGVQNDKIEKSTNLNISLRFQVVLLFSFTTGSYAWRRENYENK